jgi:hypothetical protein
MLKKERPTLDQRWDPAVAGDLAAVIDELSLCSQLYLTTKVRGLRLDLAARAEADDDEWQHAVRPAAMLRDERAATGRHWPCWWRLLSLGQLVSCSTSWPMGK